jgi:ABC-type nickel/cobalt efflux system permease component RcnA
MRIASVAFAVMTIAVMMTVSALNAIANSKNETAPRWNGSGASFQYGIVHVSMAKGGKTIPPELLPEP